jgi:uncharacterized repeat protein (TIGR03803 family)
VHDFFGPEGARPAAELIQAADGNLYGTAMSGGLGSQGTVFRVSLSGEIEAVHHFQGRNGLGEPQGSEPRAP